MVDEADLERLRATADEHEKEYERLAVKAASAARWSALANKVFSTTLVVVAATAVALMFKLQGNPPSERIDANDSLVRFTKAKEEFDFTLANFKVTQAKLYKLLEEKPDASGAKYAVLQSEVESLKTRLAGLEGAIGASPEKAVAVPVIREAVDGLSKRLGDQNAAFGREVDRLYNTFILAMTAFVSFIALLCTGILALIKYGYIAVGLGPKSFSGESKDQDSQVN